LLHNTLHTLKASPREDLIMPVDIQTILVATDFSDASAPATAYAFSLARALNARVYIMHVVPEDDVRVITAIRTYLQSEVTPETLVDALYTEAAERLATLVEEAHATELVQERLIVTGEPAVELMRCAAAKQVQLIIIGTHGRRGVTRFLMGSVAERVLREAPCAVLVVPATPQ
jgi:nucleotide-binding universal stress UspA family protein